MARILSISYDKTLARTRQMLLEHEGYRVISAIGYGRAIKLCRDQKFDLVIIGHAIPNQDKAEIVRELRQVCATPMLALYWQGQTPFAGADYSVESSEPDRFLGKVREVLGEQGVA